MTLFVPAVGLVLKIYVNLYGRLETGGNGNIGTETGQVAPLQTRPITDSPHFQLAPVNSPQSQVAPESSRPTFRVNSPHSFIEVGSLLSQPAPPSESSRRPAHLPINERLIDTYR